MILLEKHQEKADKRSIYYHESGHTAVAYITKRHVAQLTDSRLSNVGFLGLSFINPFSQLLFGKLSKNEVIFYNLIGLSMQLILEENKAYKKGEKMLKEHWSLGHGQGDIINSIRKIRKDFGKIFQKEMSFQDEEKYITICIEKIKEFLSREPKFKKFIARLAFMNQRQNLLLPEHIEEAAEYAGIDNDEKKRIRAEIGRLNLGASTFSSPLSSAG